MVDIKKLNVYVAGSSNVQELTRVKSAMARVMDHPHMHLTKNWVEVIEQHQGRANYGLSQDERIDAGLSNLQAIADSDIVWLLAPNFETRGAWFEIGFELGSVFNQVAMHAPLDGAAFDAPAELRAATFKNIMGAAVGLASIFASGNTKQSLFLAFTREFETDLDAFYELVKLADAKAAQ